MNPVTTARTRLERQTADIEVLTSRVRQVADAMFGPEPKDPARLRDGPERHGEAGLLHVAIDVLGLAIQGLAEQVDRIENLGIMSSDPGPVPLNRVK